ncbi:RHS repeat-associated core domain-containing protein [Pseudomonas sp. EMN2]|uniref:RHS repeat-associated core domain-containing protein n=1 Tax=Pseudomonas sp. EMN2 TaxID=2615212 RepID=UPI00129BEA04|nr:RHS repeat-associated core domain-containing protein [Pseudomonas sp. EMN2]
MAQQENKLFYQAQNLHHVISINEKYSLFGFNGSPLAERTTTQTLLLGIERQGTILSTIPGHALAYTPYGRRNVYSTTQPILGFNGELIQKIGDYYLLGRGYRSYNPTLMRFQSPDSQSPFKRGGINSYAYCAGDSINFIDPSGHGKVKTISINPSTPLNRVTLEHNKQIKKPPDQ